MTRSKHGAWPLLLMLACACSEDDGADGAAASNLDKDAASAKKGADPGVSYHADIRPVIERNCLGCHVEGGVGPFPLDTWEAVHGVSALVVAAVSSGRMPPWPASSYVSRTARRARVAEGDRATCSSDGSRTASPKATRTTSWRSKPPRRTTWASPT